MSSSKVAPALNFGIDSILQSSRRQPHKNPTDIQWRPISPVTFPPTVALPIPSAIRAPIDSIIRLYGCERPTHHPVNCPSLPFGYGSFVGSIEKPGMCIGDDMCMPYWESNMAMNNMPSIVQRLPLAISFRSQPAFAHPGHPTTTPSRSTANNSSAGNRHGQSKRKKTWTRAVFSSLQRKGLERSFVVQQYISKKDRRKLAATLGLTDSQVRIWYANRRMKAKKSPKLDAI